MAEMGLTGGVLVEVERIAPLGDPIQVKVRGYHLTLRREEASNVTLEFI
jgi:Fe2+ transport system protein FeoA